MTERLTPREYTPREYVQLVLSILAIVVGVALIVLHSQL